jgi:polysaccharide deacetylase 2 family uncharacterized protein YibQ
MTHISGQLQLLKKQALRHGEAIGIGHFKEKTLQAIQEVIDDFEESGIELVFLSEFYGRSKSAAGNAGAKK